MWSWDLLTKVKQISRNRHGLRTAISRIPFAGRGGLAVSIGRTSSAGRATESPCVDVTLLAANLEHTPAECLRELVAMNRFQAELQARTVPSELRRRMDAEELRAKFGALPLT